MTKNKLNLTLAISAVVFVFVTIWFIPPVYLLKWSTIEVTQYHRKEGEVQTIVGPGSKNWINSQNISRHALNAIVTAEDARFYRHNGIDLIEIWKSLETNIRKGRYARGGSTITQQVVKVAFLTREKSIIRKLREITGALILENILTKKQILEWYINLVEFGDGVYGIKNGCWHYFKTKPSQLSIAQSIHLALVLPSPNKWSKGLRHRKLTDFGHRRFHFILKRMYRSRYITEPQLKATLALGDFGNPIHGYEKYLEESTPPPESCQTTECLEETWDEDIDSLIFPTPVPATPNQSKEIKPLVPTLEPEKNEETKI